MCYCLILQPVLTHYTIIIHNLYLNNSKYKIILYFGLKILMMIAWLSINRYWQLTRELPGKQDRKNVFQHRHLPTKTSEFLADSARMGFLIIRWFHLSSTHSKNLALHHTGRSVRPQKNKNLLEELTVTPEEKGSRSLGKAETGTCWGIRNSACLNRRSGGVIDKHVKSWMSFCFKNLLIQIKLG